METLVNGLENEDGTLRLKIAVIVPTLNAASVWQEFNDKLRAQFVSPQQIWIVDSTSTDGTQDLVLESGYHLLSIARESFNHGRTRQWAAENVGDSDVLVYLTQDAILARNDSLANIVSVFAAAEIGAAYGRQLPRQGAGVLEAHARAFNYPESSLRRNFESRNVAGFKSVFASNSFAAYRVTALAQVGGFPKDVIVSEETIVFARMLQNGWTTAYVANATVYHSHNYNWQEEFRRYFDIGVLHCTERWLTEDFGQVGGEGKRFVLSELRALWPQRFYLLPALLARTCLKFIGYNLGLRSSMIPPAIARLFSQQANYWRKSSE